MHVFVHMCMCVCAYVCTCVFSLPSFIPGPFTSSQRIAVKDHLPQGVWGPQGLVPWFIHLFTDPTFIYFTPHARPRGHNAELLTQPVPVLAEQTAQQKTRWLQIQCSVKSARMETFGALRECKGVARPRFRKAEGFTEGADTYRVTRGEPGESGSVFQAGRTAAAKRGCIREPNRQRG